MARFELDDGRLRKFWEVVLDGDVLTFRYGDLGVPGRTRNKGHRSERHAKAAYDEAVRAMLAQGYCRVFEMPDSPEPSHAPMWPRLEDDPDDALALAVHADWLQSLGDVRGEVMALELAGRCKQARALREAHRAELSGWIDAFPGRVHLEWKWGYVRSIRFEPVDHRGVDPAGAAAAVLASESLRLVVDVDLQVPSAAQVAVSRPLSAVRRLSVHTGIVGGDFQASEPLDLDRLAERMPRLTSLKVRGVSELVGHRAVAGLACLDVRFAPAWIERILRNGKGLSELGVHGIDAESVEALAASGAFGGLSELSLTPAWSAQPRLLGALMAGPCARRLVLGGIDLDPPDVKVLEALVGLEELVIDGTVCPATHDALEKSRIRMLGQVRLRADEVDEEDEPSRPEDLVIRRLEYVGGRSRRFWEIGRNGSVHHVRYGRLGSRGRWIWRRFPSEDIAAEMLERRVDEKLREGYRPGEMRVVFDSTAGC